MQYRVPTPIFHITAINNLASIGSAGALLSKRLVKERGLVAADIAFGQVQDRRAVKQIPIPPGGTLHDYVPFYFAPRSPMLMTINSGNVPGCDYRQDDIVHLVSAAQVIGDGGQSFVFSDFHAVKAYATFYDNLAHLDEIDWRIFFEPPLLDGWSKYFFNRPEPAHHMNRQESRMAEFLVLQQVPVAAISEIGVRTERGEAQIRAALAGTGWNPDIRVVPNWYF
jgi:hypothetical protein